MIPNRYVKIYIDPSQKKQAFKQWCTDYRLGGNLDRSQSPVEAQNRNHYPDEARFETIRIVGGRGLRSDFSTWNADTLDVRSPSLPIGPESIVSSMCKTSPHCILCLGYHKKMWHQKTRKTCHKPLLVVHGCCHQFEKDPRSHSLYVPKGVARWLTSRLQDVWGIVPVRRGRRIHGTCLLGPVGRRWLIRRVDLWSMRAVMCRGIT